MTTIEIEPQHRGADVAAEVQRALEVLRGAHIKALRRVRSLEMMGLIQVPDADAERAVTLFAFRAYACRDPPVVIGEPRTRTS